MPPSTNLHNKTRQKSTCTMSAILADELLGMTTLSSKARFRGARFREARVGTKRRHDADVVGPRRAHIRRILNNVEPILPGRRPTVLEPQILPGSTVAELIRLYHRARDETIRNRATLTTLPNPCCSTRRLRRHKVANSYWPW